MKILDLYIIKKFLGTFFYAISLLILVVIVFDISENIDEFLDHNAPISDIIVDYYVNFIPYFINLFRHRFLSVGPRVFNSAKSPPTHLSLESDRLPLERTGLMTVYSLFGPRRKIGYNFVLGQLSVAALGPCGPGGATWRLKK